jgi:hypothetical protein
MLMIAYSFKIVDNSSMSIETDPCKILEESVQDAEGKYIHTCGQILIGKVVHITVIGTGPNRAGSGEVVRMIQPCCPPCGIEPPDRGTIHYSATPAADESRILGNL